MDERVVRFSFQILEAESGNCAKWLLPADSVTEPQAPEGRGAGGEMERNERI
jgi:hypothetical protein